MTVWSETTRVRVRFFSFGDEEIPFYGIASDAPNEPAVVSVNYQESLGAPAPQVTIVVKDPEKSLYALEDDAWFDLSFSRHGVWTHVMRGRVDTITEDDRVVNGALVSVLEITTRGFGSIFDISPVHFDIITEDDEAVTPGLMIKILDQIGLHGDPSKTVQGLCSGFLGNLFQTGKMLWPLPPGLDVPRVNAVTGEDQEVYFLHNLAYFTRDFKNDPERFNNIAYNIWPDPKRSIWSYLQEFADLPLCELYPTLLVQDPNSGGLAGSADDVYSLKVVASGLDYPEPDNDRNALHGLGDDETYMALVHRDRPFLTITRSDAGGKAEAIEDGPWFRLKTYEAAFEDLVLRRVARSGAARRNAFYAGIRGSSLSNNYWDLLAPTWNPEAVKRHGFRRSDWETLYSSVTDDAEFLLLYRRRLRDFHAMNHLLYTGELGFGHGRPDIRVGQKLRLTGGGRAEETYYIEGVQHTWTGLQNGLKTRLLVTYGMIGGDVDRVAVFERLIAAYRTVDPGTGLHKAQPEPNGPIDNTIDDNAYKISRQQGRQYKPGTPAWTQLWTEACQIAGAPLDWADSTTTEGADWAALINKESFGGYVGIPNGFAGGSWKRWNEIWAQNRAATQHNSKSVWHSEANSCAVGLGQLLWQNAVAYYPSGAAGIGVALEEAVGALKYLLNSGRGARLDGTLISTDPPKFDPTPSAAWAYHKINNYW